MNVFRKKHAPPPSVLLLTLPKVASPIENQPKDRSSPAAQLRSQQRKSRQATHHVSLHLRDTLSKSAPHWQRYSEKVSQIMPAPDVAYRNTYLDGQHREQSACSPRYLHASNGKSIFDTSSPSSSRPRNNSNHSRTIYDHILQSIKEIEQQRNTKQANISIKIKRSQNEDQIFRRVVGEKKLSARSYISRSTSKTVSTANTKSSSISENLKSAQSFVNYINYSRFFQTALSNES